NEIIDVNGTRVSQAVGEVPSTRALAVFCNDNNGVLQYHWDGYIRAYRLVACALTAAEIAREFVLMEADVT
ncbi:MAG TPA: hypothetical protein VM487_16240, partial [Phycisphaerae bacterium]|nr:hypothetical protein [Phycisphaerae bacterium]